MVEILGELLLLQIVSRVQVQAGGEGGGQKDEEEERGYGGGHIYGGLAASQPCLTADFDQHSELCCSVLKDHNEIQPSV